MDKHLFKIFILGHHKIAVTVDAVANYQLNKIYLDLLINLFLKHVGSSLCRCFSQVENY